MAQNIPVEFEPVAGGSLPLSEVQLAVQRKLAMAGDEAEFTPEELAEKISMPVAWVRKHQHEIPGRFRYTNKCVRFHWGTHKQEMQKRR